MLRKSGGTPDQRLSAVHRGRIRTRHWESVWSAFRLVALSARMSRARQPYRGTTPQAPEPRRIRVTALTRRAAPRPHGPPSRSAGASCSAAMSRSRSRRALPRALSHYTRMRSRVHRSREHGRRLAVGCVNVRCVNVRCVTVRCIAMRFMAVRSAAGPERPRRVHRLLKQRQTSSRWTLPRPGLDSGLW